MVHTYSTMLRVSPLVFTFFFMTLTLQSPNAFHLIEQTQLTRAVITALMIPIYFSFNEQTVGIKKQEK